MGHNITITLIIVVVYILINNILDILNMHIISKWVLMKKNVILFTEEIVFKL